MTEELEEYYNTLVFKDNAQTRYFFDITAKMGDKAYPIISILQNRKNATGAETFKNAIEQILKNKKFTSVLVVEYNNCCDDAEAISRVEFELKKSKKMAKRKSNTPQPFNGFGNLGEANSFLEGFGKSLGMLGVEGGLSGIIKSSAAMIAQQDKLEGALGQISELKIDKKDLENELKRYKEKNEELRDELKKAEYKLWDAERDSKNKIENLQNKLTLGSLASTGIIGALTKKFRLDEKLAGFLDEDTATAATDTAHSDLSSVNLQASNPETAQTIAEINNYLNTLDKSRIDLIYAICQYCSQSDNELKQVYRFTQKAYQQNTTNLTSENNG